MNKTNVCQVLVVDDDLAVRASLSAYLEDFNLDVFSAASGSDAIKILRAEKMDVIIMDLRLGDMSGEDLMRQIRAEFHQVHIMIFTGTPSKTQDDLISQVNISSEFVFQKPQVDLGVFVAAIKRLGFLSDISE